MPGTRRRWGLLAVGLSLMAGCGTSGAASSADLADTVTVDGFRKVDEYRKADTTSYYFVGPPGADLRKVVSARDWAPQPAPTGFPDTTNYEWLLKSNADIDGFTCTVVVQKLRPKFSQLASGLTAEEVRDVAAGRLDYLDVSSVCTKL